MLSALVFLTVSLGMAQQKDFTYRPPDKINQAVTQIVNQNQAVASLLQLAQTPGGREICRR